MESRPGPSCNVRATLPKAYRQRLEPRVVIDADILLATTQHHIDINVNIIIISYSGESRKLHCVFIGDQICWFLANYYSVTLQCPNTQLHHTRHLDHSLRHYVEHESRPFRTRSIQLLPDPSTARDNTNNDQRTDISLVNNTNNV